MKEKLLWIAVILLLLLSLVQGYYIYTARDGEQKAGGEQAPDAQWPELENWRKETQKQLLLGNPLPARDFDAFFDDRFFGRKYDPFAEMDRVHRQMLNWLRESEKFLFNESWDKWFAERMTMGRFKTEISRTEKNVILTIDVPGINSKELKVDINRGRIRISFSARASGEERKAGGVTRSESSQSYIKILPVPAGALADTAVTTRDGERVVITFDRETGSD